MPEEVCHLTRVQIDPTGAMWLLLILLTAKMFTPEPRMLSLKVGTSAWLVVLLSGLVALVGYYGLLALLRRFPGQSLSEIYLQTWGRGVGMAAVLTQLVYFLWLSGLMLREFVEGFRIAVMPRTPPSALSLMIMAVVLFAAFRGLEGIVRLASYMAPFLAVLAVLMVLGVIHLMDFGQVLPLFGNGLTLTLWYALPESSLYSEILVLGTLAQVLSARDVGGVGTKAMLLGIGVQTALFVVLEAVFPYPALSRLFFPMLDLTRMIEVSEFIQRVEALFVFLWFFTAAFKLTTLIFAAAGTLRDAAGIPDCRPLLPALGLLVFALSFVPEHQVALVWADSETVRLWGWVVSFGVPILTLGLAALRRKRGAAGGLAAT